MAVYLLKVDTQTGRIISGSHGSPKLVPRAKIVDATTRTIRVTQAIYEVASAQPDSMMYDKRDKAIKRDPNWSLVQRPILESERS